MLRLRTILSIAILIFTNACKSLVTTKPNQALSTVTSSELENQPKTHWTKPFLQVCNPTSSEQAWQDSVFFRFLRGFLKKHPTHFTAKNIKNLQVEIETFLKEHRQDEKEELLVFYRKAFEQNTPRYSEYYRPGADIFSLATIFAFPESLNTTFPNWDNAYTETVRDEVLSETVFPKGLAKDKALKILKVLLSLNFRPKYVLNQYSFLEFLVKKLDLPIEVVMELIQQYLSQSGFTLIREIPSLPVYIFMEKIAQASIWKEGYAAANGVVYLQKTWPDYLKRYGSISKTLEEIYLKKVRDIEPIPHGLYSHMFQTFVQARYLEDCGIINNFPKTDFLQFRKIPWLTNEKTRQTRGTSHKTWDIFWRSINDSFADQPVFASAHFNSFLLEIAAPSISKVNLGIVKIE